MKNTHNHIDAERMQALLDGDLSAREAGALRAELDGCPRCHAEFEGWQLLFDELEELPALAPSAHFGDRVLESLPVPERRPMLARLFGRRSATGHASSTELQEHLDGRLAARSATRLEEHLAGCARCRSEMDGLHRVVRELDALPMVAPSPDFGEAVMASVRVQLMTRMVMAPTSRWERAVQWLRSRVPSTGRGWAAVLGAGTAPAVVLALVIQSVFSHELVTVGNLVTFLGFKLAGLWEAALAMMPQAVFDNPVLGVLGTAGAWVSTSPTLVAATAVAASGTCLAAIWVLYRNLLLPSVEEGAHA